MSQPIEIYTNAVRMAASIFEVALHLDLNTLDSSGLVDSKHVATVRMSPQQAMAVSTLLITHLKVYEKAYKEIYLPQEMMEKLQGSHGNTEDVNPTT